MRNRIVGVAIAAGVLLAACGGDDDTATSDTDDVPAEAMTTDGQGSRSGAGPAAGSQPETSTASAAATPPASDAGGVAAIEHAYGTTELDDVPQRVVTLDAQWTDVMLAMDVEPVGALGDTYVEGDGRYTWQQDLLPSEVMLNGSGGIPFEQIAKLEPDLILGVNFLVDSKHKYDVLNEIAPTIVGPLTDRDVDKWQDLTTTAGEILHRPEQAANIIDDVDRQVSQLKSDLPGLAGKTFALAQYVVGDGLYVVADPEDGSSILFRDLGMEMSPSVIDAAQRGPGDAARLQLSREQVGVVESDFLTFLINGGDESNLSELPAWDTLPSVRNDAVAILDYDTIVGINTPTPLSLPHALDELRPALEAAAAS